MRPRVELHDGLASFRGYVPTPPLDADIALIWIVEGFQPAARERILPNGVTELIVNLGPPHRVLDARGPGAHDVHKRAWFSGAHSRPLDIACDGETRLVGVRFHTGGAAAFLRVPMAELAGRVVDVDCLDPHLTTELRDALGDAPNDAARVRTVERVLLARRTRRDGRVARACRAVTSAGDRMTIARVASGLGVSHKHLVELFARDVGLTPKLYARIMRLQRVLAELSRGSARVADIALACGYCDQSHLAGEFRALAGTSIREYLAARSVDPNHVILE